MTNDVQDTRSNKNKFQDRSKYANEKFFDDSNQLRMLQLKMVNMLSMRDDITYLPFIGYVVFKT